MFRSETALSFVPSVVTLCLVQGLVQRGKVAGGGGLQSAEPKYKMPYCFYSI